MGAEFMSEFQEELVQIEFSIGIGDASLGFQSYVPAGQTNLTQILPAVQSIENAILGAVFQGVEEEGRHISCKASCASCCRQMVPISIFEAESLANWIRTLPDDQQEILRGRFQFVLESLSKSGMIDRLVTEDWFSNSRATQEMAVEYLHQWLACPFLVNENCTIHPIRPLSCREYLVTSPPENCADPATLPVDGVRLPLKLSRALYRMGIEVDGGSRGWIPLVFLFAWMKGNFTPGESYTGAGPEVFYEFLKRVGTESATVDSADSEQTE
jgi:Fe-S-cluster containining protein